MSTRGRVPQRYVEYVSDDEDGSYYEDLGYPAPPKRSTSRLRVDVREDRQRSPARRQKVYRPVVGHPASEAENIIIENHLNVPQVARPRASSTGAAPQPNYLQPIYVQPPSREPSRERHKHYHRHYEYSESSDDDRASSRHRRRRRKSSPRSPSMDPEIAKRLAKLELLEQEKRKPYMDQDTVERLARLKYLEKSKEQKEEEAIIVAKYQERQRQEEEAEAAAIAAAEAKRLKKENEMKAERERLTLLERDRIAKEKAERQRIWDEEKSRADREKKEAEEERKRIIYEEELRKKKEKQEHEELRKQILAEEEEKIAKEKAKKKKEEDEFQMKVKERFMKAGYSPEYIEDILEQKKRLTRTTSTRNSENKLAIDLSRPTYIRVKLEHLYPETLDYYALPWDYDPDDDKYVLIKEYISHEFQQELFEHTRKLKIKRETRLITDGYTKDTTTILKPRNVYKNKDSDELYVVRKKSQSKSKSPMRSSWMFT